MAVANSEKCTIDSEPMRFLATDHSRQDRHALIALLLGSLGICFAPVLAKLAVQIDGPVGGVILSPVAVAFWRMVIAAPIFLVFTLLGRPDARALAAVRSHWRWLLLPGLMLGLDLGLWHWAFEYTSVANATVEVNLSVLLVAVSGWWGLGERFSPLFIVGALAALGGMVAVVGASFAGEGRAWIGDLMGLGVAFAYAGYQLSMKMALRKLPVQLLMAGATLASALFLGLAAALSPGRFFPATSDAWYCLGALALSSQVLGQGLIAFGMRRLPATFTSVVLVLQPVGAAVLGWLVLDQALSPGQLLGGALVIGGIVLARLGSLGAARTASSG